MRSSKADHFSFEFSPSSPNIQPGAGGVHSWIELEKALIAEKTQQGADYLMGVLDEPIENNWFSHAATGKGVAWITLHNWEFYSDAPVECGLAYQLIQNFMIMLLVRTPQEERWLFDHVVHNISRGCISDMCSYKPDISRGIRAGGICTDCQEIIASKVGAAYLRDFEGMLQRIRDAAANSEPRTYFSEFADRAFAIAPLERQPPPIPLPTLERDVIGGASRDIECGYPFPIAYCFRSLRAEYRPHERWQAMYELYRLVVRYVAFVLLADGSALRSESAPRAREKISKLKFASDGEWGSACGELLRNLAQASRRNTVLASLQESFDVSALAEIESVSKSFVKTRNRLAEGHGFRGDKQAYQELFETHLPALKLLLRFMSPIAKYVLIRPVEIVDHVDGQCIYHAKVLMGSDAQFVTNLLRCESPPQTVCQLLIPGQDRPLALHPWLHLDRCESCRREMVFLYDAVHLKNGRRQVVLREYPSNHELQRPDLCEKVDRALAL
jgi:hypothetical protein